MRIAKLVFAVLLACVSVARAEVITFANGDQLNGEIVRTSGTIIYFNHPQLGEMEVARDLLLAVDTPRRPSQATGVGIPSSRRPEASEADPEDQAAPQKGGLFGTRLLRGWHSTFGVGLTGSDGGFEDTKLNILFTTDISDEKRSWLIDSYYFLNVTPEENVDDSTPTKNQAMLMGRHDWLRTEDQRWSRVFLFAQGRYRFDQFQTWKHRIGAHLGPGFEVLRDSRFRWWDKLGAFDFDVRTGLGTSYAFGALDDIAGEFLVGFTFVWRLNSWSKVRSVNEWILDLQDADTFRTNQQLDWDIDVAQQGGLGVRLGSRFQHDTTSEGRENDLTYLLSLTYDF